MIYRKLGDSDLMCSVVGLGTWGMGGDSWAGSGQVDDDLSIATLQEENFICLLLFSTGSSLYFSLRKWYNKQNIRKGG